MEALATGPQPAHEGLHWRIWGAEATGTGLLMLGGLSVIALDGGRHSPVAEVIPSASLRLLLTGLLFAGCVTLIAVSPLGRLSGAHINPAVTLAFRVMGRVSRSDLAGYLIAQFAGAALGTLAFRLLWGDEALSVRGGATHPTVPVPAAFALEAGMTAALVATIFLFDARESLVRWTPLAIVPVIAVLVWAVGPYTGTSLNPARSEGPAVAFGDFADLWLYLLAPTAGAIAVAALWKRARPGRQPKTAKLFHDPRYPSSLASDMPARGVSSTAGSRRAGAGNVT